MEKTLVLIKPCGVQRGLIGKIIERIENKGFMIHGMKMISVSLEQAKMHYNVHKGKIFYENLIKYITSGPVIALVLSGNNSVSIMRNMAGATDPLKSLPGTIRGDFSNDISINVVHTSDSVERALYEISIFFTVDEQIQYDKSINKDIFTKF